MYITVKNTGMYSIYSNELVMCEKCPVNHKCLGIRVTISQLKSLILTSLL